MTAATLVFLTLFTWILSSGSWLSLDQSIQTSQDEHHEAKTALNASCKNSVTREIDTTKQALIYKRSSEMKDNHEKILTHERFTIDDSLVSTVSLGCTLLCPHLKLMQRIDCTTNTAEDKSCSCKGYVLQFEVYFLSKTAYFLPNTEINSDDFSTQLHYWSVDSSSVLLRCVPHWKTMDHIRIFKTCNPEVRILQNSVCKETEDGFPEYYYILVMTDSQIRPLTSEALEKAFLRVGFVKMLLNPSHGSRVFLTQAERLKLPVYKDDILDLDSSFSSKCVRRLFLAAALTFVIYTRRVKLSNPVSPGHNYNSTLVFSLMMQCFTASAALHHPSEWLFCLFHLFSKIIYVLIVCKSLHAVVKIVCPSQQQRALNVTTLFLWLTLTVAFSYNSLKPGPKEVNECTGSTLRSWVTLGQTELLAHLFCLFLFFPPLFQFILTKLNCLSVFFHLQLVTCRQNSRIPIKYVLVVRINRLM